jgi:hypothetical protein
VANNISPEAARQIAEGLAANGRVLATLDDWRAMLFGVVIMAVVVTCVLVGVIVVLLRANRQERAEMSARLDRTLTVADKFGTAAGQLTGELQVQQALNARVETALGRCEDLLSELERRPGGKRP